MNHDELDKTIGVAFRSALTRAGIDIAKITDVTSSGTDIFLGGKSCDNITFELKTLPDESSFSGSNELPAKQTNYGVAFYAALSHI